MKEEICQIKSDILKFDQISNETKTHFCGRKMGEGQEKEKSLNKNANTEHMATDILTDAIVNRLIFQSGTNGVLLMSLFRYCPDSN